VVKLYPMVRRLKSHSLSVSCRNILYRSYRPPHHERREAYPSTRGCLNSPIYDTSLVVPPSNCPLWVCGSVAPEPSRGAGRLGPGFSRTEHKPKHEPLTRCANWRPKQVQQGARPKLRLIDHLVSEHLD
jgi:hypothetical protein